MPASQYLGKRLYSKSGAEYGTITNTSICLLEGCGGTRLHVLWKDGKRTYPCAKGCYLADGHYQIGDLRTSHRCGFSTLLVRGNACLVDVSKNASSGEGDQVEVPLWRQYGAMIVCITEEGNIVLKAVDGAGTVLNTVTINPDQACGVAEEDEVKLPDVPAKIDEAKDKVKKAGMGRQPKP